MGKHIIFDDDLYRIDLGDGDYVDILEKIPGSIRRKAHEATTKAGGKFDPKNRDKNTEIDFNFKAGEFNRVILCEMIKSWSFAKKNGEPLPVTAENIGRLSEETETIILEKINELNPGRDDDEKKDSSTNSTMP